MAQRGEGEQRIDGCQTGVAGADAVVALGFQVLEERSNQQGVEVANLKLRAAATLRRAHSTRTKVVTWPEPS
jgi:hypothetical protein